MFESSVLLLYSNWKHSEEDFNKVEIDKDNLVIPIVVKQIREVKFCPCKLALSFCLKGILIINFKLGKEGGKRDGLDDEWEWWK